jgi:hypothetical protein
MRKPLLAVEALRLQPAVPQHLGDLSILLPVLAEDQLALVVVILVFTTSPIFSSLVGRGESIAAPWCGDYMGLRTFPLFCTAA